MHTLEMMNQGYDRKCRLMFLETYDDILLTDLVCDPKLFTFVERGDQAPFSSSWRVLHAIISVLILAALERKLPAGLLHETKSARADLVKCEMCKVILCHGR